MITQKDLSALRLGRAHTAALSDMLTRIEALEAAKPAPAPAPVPVTPPAPPVATVPPVMGTPRRRYWFPHWMGSFDDGLEPGDQTCNRTRAVLCNALWWHTDIPVRATVNDNERNYRRRLLAMLAAGQATGFPVIPGFHGGWGPYDGNACTLDFFRAADHPAVMLDNRGRRVLLCYDLKPDTPGFIDHVRANGFPRDRFAVWAFVEPWDDNAWQAAHGGSGRRTWDGFGDFMDRTPQIDGWVNFNVNLGVGMGTEEAVARTIDRNRHLIDAAHARGLEAIAGFSIRYVEPGTFSAGQLARMTSAAMDADGWTFATANDIGREQSHGAKLGTDFATEGGRPVTYLPPRSAGWTFGPDVPRPCPDQSAFLDVLMRPLAQAFLAQP